MFSVKMQMVVMTMTATALNIHNINQLLM